MKKTKKALLLALCAILLVGATIASTVAYLTSQQTVTNTFTVGKVEITLTEKEIDPQTGKKLTNAADVTALQKIELIPGRIIEKNPVITVSSDSEECYLFVKIDNDLLSAGVINGLTGWVSIQGNANVDGVSYYRYNTTVNAGEAIPVFETFTCNTSLEYDAGLIDKQIVITAYAIQAENLDVTTAAEALGLPH